MTIDAKALAAQLRADMGITGSRSKVPGGAYAKIARLIGYGDMGWPHAVTVAMLGIAHATLTGRLDHTITDQIRGLSDWQMCTLVADVAANCNVQGEVSSYLIQRYAPKP